MAMACSESSRSVPIKPRDDEDRYVVGSGWAVPFSPFSVASAMDAMEGLDENGEPEAHELDGAGDEFRLVPFGSIKLKNWCDSECLWW